MAFQPMLFALIINKTFYDGTTGSETTGQNVEGFENPVFRNQKNEGNFINQTPVKLDANNLKI